MLMGSLRAKRRSNIGAGSDLSEIASLVALALLAFVQNALGLAGVTPEAQQIVTGLVLVTTLVIFGAVKAIRGSVVSRRLK